MKNELKCTLKNKAARGTEPPAAASATDAGCLPAQAISEPTLLDEKISNIFIIIGIPAHIKGYHYLREAIKLTAGNFEMVCGITKNLYPRLASRFNTSSCGVARSMRNAIDVAWNKGKIVNLNTIFGCVVYERNEKPSNSELIALLAEKVYLECSHY